MNPHHTHHHITNMIETPPQTNPTMNPPLPSLRHIWELPGNYPVLAVVMAIFHYVERIWRIIVTPNFSYNIYDHGKYYPGEPVNIPIQ